MSSPFTDGEDGTFEAVRARQREYRALCRGRDLDELRTDPAVDAAYDAIGKAWAAIGGVPGVAVTTYYADLPLLVAQNRALMPRKAAHGANPREGVITPPAPAWLDAPPEDAQTGRFTLPEAHMSEEWRALYENAPDWDAIDAERDAEREARQRRRP